MGHEIESRVQGGSLKNVSEIIFPRFPVELFHSLSSSFILCRAFSFSVELFHSLSSFFILCRAFSISWTGQKCGSSFKEKVDKR
jgi:hypothetical protein